MALAHAEIGEGATVVGAADPVEVVSRWRPEGMPGLELDDAAERFVDAFGRQAADADGFAQGGDDRLDDVGPAQRRSLAHAEHQIGTGLDRADGRFGRGDEPGDTGHL
jgi:hypothetical protein